MEEDSGHTRDTAGGQGSELTVEMDAWSSSTLDATLCCKENLYFYGLSFASKVSGQKSHSSHL